MSKRSRAESGGESTRKADPRSYKKTEKRTYIYKNPRSGAENRTFDYNGVSIAPAMSCSFDGAVAPSPFAPAATRSLGCINQIPRDTSSITRIGRRCQINAVAIRGQVAANSSGVTTTSTHVAVMLVWDRNIPIGSTALPPINQILLNQSSSALTNKDNASRFKIVRRWDFQVAPRGQDGDCFAVDEFVKFKDKQTVWTNANTSGTFTEMTNGALYLLTVSPETIAGHAPVFFVNTRVYYSDQN